jgi:serine/threonine protein kinase
MATYKSESGNLYQTEKDMMKSGGEGSIYRVVGQDNIVAKIYNPEKRTTERERKVLAMTRKKPDAAMLDQCAWPSEALYDNGKFMGYAMPKLSGSKNLRELYPYGKRGNIPWDIFINIARNLSLVLRYIHNLGQIIGDFNPDNILVENSGLVRLVDTDSFHISDEKGRVFPCTAGQAPFLAPEMQNIGDLLTAPLPTFTKETDQFSLSILIFHLLLNGAHPFACSVLVGSASKFQPIDNIIKGLCPYFSDSKVGNVAIPKYAPRIETMPLEIQDLFYRAFVKGHTQPTSRPSGEEWYDALGRLQNNLKHCSVNPEHIYYAKSPCCPWCEVKQKMSGAGKQSTASSPSPLPQQQQVPIPIQTKPASPPPPVYQPPRVNPRQPAPTTASSQSPSFDHFPIGKVASWGILLVAAYWVYSFIFSGSAVPPPPPLKGQAAYIDGINVFFRPTPSKAQPGPFLQKNFRVTVFGERNMSDGKWYNVGYNGKFGWVFSKYVIFGTPREEETVQAKEPVQTKAAVSDAPKNKTSLPKKSASTLVQEGEQYWREKKWDKAYEAFKAAYALDKSRETQVKRDNALANVRAEKAAREEEARKRQMAEEDERRRIRQENERLRALEEEKQAEKERQVATRQQNKEENAALLRTILGIGALIYENNKK